MLQMQVQVLLPRVQEQLQVQVTVQAAQLESAARLKQLSELALLTQRVEEQMNNIEREMGLWLDE